MPIISTKNLQLSFGDFPVLDHVNLSIEKGERICLVGRNGEGKSTLLKVLAGQLKPDDGEVIYTQGVRISELPQEVPVSLAGTVYDVVAAGIGDLGYIIKEWHHTAIAV